MTRKDYVAIADVLNRTRPLALSEIGIGQLAQWRMIYRDIAKTLSADNPRFDLERFAAACGFTA